MISKRLRIKLDKLESTINSKIFLLRELIEKEDFEKVKKLNREITDLKRKSLNLWLRILKLENPKIRILCESDNCIVCKVLRSQKS